MRPFTAPRNEIKWRLNNFDENLIFFVFLCGEKTNSTVSFPTLEHTTYENCPCEKRGTKFIEHTSNDRPCDLLIVKWRMQDGPETGHAYIQKQSQLELVFFLESVSVFQVSSDYSCFNNNVVHKLFNSEFCSIA